jgi:hypothetical protein
LAADLVLGANTSSEISQGFYPQEECIYSLSRGKNVAVMQTMETTQTQQTEQVKEQVKLGEFGNGRYSPVMRELFGDTKRLLGFSDSQAHATAARLGIDLGRLTSGEARVNYGKTVSKDGYRTVREACSVKMPNSWALSIAVICNGLDDLRKQGLEVGENTIKDNLMEFVSNAAERLVKQ